MFPELEIEVDKDSPIPTYYQLKEQLALLIRNGTFPVGGQLPPESLISEQLGISRGTVRQAINGLVVEGRLKRARGRGTFVTEPSVALHLVQHFASLAEDMQARNIPFSIQVLAKKVMPAKGRLVSKLGVQSGEDVYYLERLGAMNDEPFVLAFSYLPARLCSALLEIDLTDKSLYGVLEGNYNLQLGCASRTLEASRADKYEAKLLHVPQGSPIHFMQSLAYLEDGRPIEYSRLRFRGDRSRISFEVKRKT